MSAIKLMITYLIIGSISASLLICASCASEDHFTNIFKEDKIHMSDLPIKEDKIHMSDLPIKEDKIHLKTLIIEEENLDFLESVVNIDSSEDVVDIDHPGLPGSNESELWIVSPYSSNVRTAYLEIAKDRTAKELIIPDMSGTLTLYEEYPNGENVSYYSDFQVVKGHVYRTWFQADTIGRHKLRYEVYDSKSNVTSYSNEIVYDVIYGSLVVVVPDVMVYERETGVMQVIANGGCDNGNYSYQWYEGKSSLTDGMILVGETNSTIYILADKEGCRNFTCKVTCPGDIQAEDWGYLCVLDEDTRIPPENEDKGRVYPT